MRRLPLAAFTLALLAACATAPRAPAADPGGAPAPAPAADALCEPPFTAAQIRAATRVGRTYDFEVESPGAPVSGLRLRFVEVTETHARIERTTVGADGQATAPTRSSTVSWDELVRHAAWPASATTIEPARVSVPAGEYGDALLYTVRETMDGKAKVTRAWFVRALPGAPVVHEVEVGGAPVATMRLVRYVPGG